MAHKRLTLLLIDDDEDTQLMFALLATYHGGSVFAVKDAESALNYLENHRPDIIVIDLYLENTDGYQTLHWIRQSAFNPHCPIVAATAFFTPMTLSRSVLSGFDGYLEKPIQFEGLWTYFEELTNQARQG